MIDTHVHLWDPAHGYDWLRSAAPELNRKFSLIDLATASAATAITGMILVEASAGRADEIDHLLTAAASSSLIAGVVAPFRLSDHPIRTVADVRDKPNSQHVVGFRDSGRATGQLTSAGLRRLGRSLAVQAQAIEMMVTPATMDQTTPTVDSLSSARVVLNHAAAPPSPTDVDLWATWRRGIASLSERPHVSLKLSGLLTLGLTADQILTVGEIVLNAFGAERIMLGSDWPVCLASGSYAASLTAANTAVGQASKAERESIESGTARLIYNLPRPT